MKNINYLFIQIYILMIWWWLFDSKTFGHFTAFCLLLCSNNYLRCKNINFLCKFWLPWKLQI